MRLDKRCLFDLGSVSDVLGRPRRQLTVRATDDILGTFSAVHAFTKLLLLTLWISCGPELYI